jgi:hypothetical protein
MWLYGTPKESFFTEKTSHADCFHFKTWVSTKGSYMKLYHYFFLSVSLVLLLFISHPVLSQTPDGDLAPLGNRDGIVNVGDALVCLRFSLNLNSPTQEDITHGDVAPLDAQGVPNPDGTITVGDALVILRKALGIISWELDEIIGPAPSPPRCANQIPEEPTADGDYRSYVSPIETYSSNPRVAMATNGWRALAMSDHGLDLFDRDNNAPLAHFPVNEPFTAALSLAHDGSAFAVADTNLLGSVRLRYFECGASTPVWSWVSNGGSWPKVVIGSQGKWIALTTNGPEYFALFRRDQHKNGIGKPVASNEFDWQYPIRRMSFSGEKPCAAVITSSSFDDQYSLHLIDCDGISWTSALSGSQWTTPDGICMDMSTDGTSVVVGGFGGLIRFFSAQSATPLWTLSLDPGGHQEAYITGIDLSQDGSSLSFLVRKYDYTTLPGEVPDIPRDIVYYIRDTSSQPVLGHDGNWRWLGNEAFGWRDTSPYPTPKANITPYFLNAFCLQRVALSEDGQYVFVSGTFHYQDGQTASFVENRTAGISFHRDMGDPLRIYLSGDTGIADRDGAISPDGSWVIMAGETNVARFEVAPVERIRCSQPIEVDIPIIGSLLGLGMVTIDYTVYKTGRASRLRQDWDLYMMPFGELLGNVLTCTGDFTFDYPLLVPAGNEVVQSSRELDLPNCSVGETIGVEGYDVFSTLKNKSGRVHYSTDQTTVFRFTIPE